MMKFQNCGMKMKLSIQFIMISHIKINPIDPTTRVSQNL